MIDVLHYNWDALVGVEILNFHEDELMLIVCLSEFVGFIQDRLEIEAQNKVYLLIIIQFHNSWWTELYEVVLKELPVLEVMNGAEVWKKTQAFREMNWDHLLIRAFCAPGRCCSTR